MNYFRNTASSVQGYQEGTAVMLNFQEGSGNLDYQKRSGNLGYQEGSGTQDYQEGTAGNLDYQEGTAGNLDYQEGTAGNLDYQEGTTGNLDNQEGTAGNMDYQEGTAGNLDYQEGTAGNPDYQEGTAGNPDYQEGTAGNLDYQEGSGNLELEGTAGILNYQEENGNLDYKEGAAGNLECQEGAAGIPDYQEGAAGIQDYQEGAVGIQDYQEGTVYILDCKEKSGTHEYQEEISTKSENNEKNECDFCEQYIFGTPDLVNTCDCTYYCEDCREIIGNFTENQQTEWSCVLCKLPELNNAETRFMIKKLMIFYNAIDISSVSAFQFLMPDDDEQDVYTQNQGKVESLCPGYQVTLVQPDGHCSLHAIALAYLYTKELEHMDRKFNTIYLVKILIKEFVENSDNYTGFMTGENVLLKYYWLVHQYLLCKVFDSEIGDMVPDILSKLLKINLRIHKIDFNLTKEPMERLEGGEDDKFVEIALYDKHYYTLSQ